MLLLLALLDKPEEKELFETVYHAYERLLWYVAFQILQDEQLAEDCVQDTFLTLTSHMNQVKNAFDPRTKQFLVTIAKNRAFDLLRSRTRRREDFPEEPFEAASEEDILEEYLAGERMERIKDCIRQLPEDYRVVLEYRYLYDLSEKEIASLLQCAPKTINVRVYRARVRLQKLLKQQEV